MFIMYAAIYFIWIMLNYCDFLQLCQMFVAIQCSQHFKAICFTRKISFCLELKVVLNWKGLEEFLY